MIGLPSFLGRALLGHMPLRRHGNQQADRTALPNAVRPTHRVFQHDSNTVYEASDALIQSCARHLFQRGVNTLRLTHAPPTLSICSSLQLSTLCSSLRMPAAICSSLRMPADSADGARRTALCTPLWTCCRTRRRTCRTNYLPDLRGTSRTSGASRTSEAFQTPE